MQPRRIAISDSSSIARNDYRGDDTIFEGPDGGLGLMMGRRSSTTRHGISGKHFRGDQSILEGSDAGLGLLRRDSVSATNELRQQTAPSSGMGGRLIDRVDRSGGRGESKRSRLPHRKALSHRPPLPDDVRKQG